MIDLNDIKYVLKGSDAINNIVNIFFHHILKGVWEDTWIAPNTTDEHVVGNWCETMFGEDIGVYGVAELEINKNKVPSHLPLCIWHSARII